MTKKTGRLRKGFAPVAALLLLLALLAAIPALQAVRNPAQPDAPHVGGTGASEDATEAQSESKLPEVCKQLSEEALALDTEQLIEEILKSTNIFMRAGLDSSGTNWYRFLREHSNGIRELESRPDAGNRLLELYLVESGKAEPERVRLLSLIDLLDVPVFRDMLTADECARLERNRRNPFVHPCKTEAVPQSESKLPEVCKQLSEEALALDTEQLIEEILKATDIFMHAGLDSSGTNWYPSLREHFNGIRELESRPDAGNRLLELCLVEYGKAEPEMRRLVSMLDLLDIPVFRDMLTADERAMMERDWLKPFVVAGTR